MSTLTERLHTASGWDHLTLVQEAADRIEHLERVLVQAREDMRQLKAMAGRGEYVWRHATDAIAAIDKALKEKAPTNPKAD
jgi:hypothetical protein